MSVAKESTHLPDLREEEIYNLEQIEYHREQAKLSWAEVKFHEQMILDHVRRMEGAPCLTTN